jgi:hypothetical protein
MRWIWLVCHVAEIEKCFAGESTSTVFFGKGKGREK